MSKITRRPGLEPAPSTPRKEPEKPAAKEPAPKEKDAGWQPPSRSLTSNASDAADALVTGATIISPPSVLTPPAPGSTAASVSNSAHGASLSAGRTSGGSAEVLSAEVSRATLTVSGTRTGNGSESSVSASLAKNYLSVVAGGTRGANSASATSPSPAAR